MTVDPGGRDAPNPDPGGVEGREAREREGEEGSQVGDLVVIPVPRVREQVGCGERVGIVLEERRRAAKVLFPEIDRAFWLERGSLLSIPEGRLPAALLALRLHRVARAVGAVEIEIYDREGDADVFHVFTRGTDLDALLAIREGLGADFRRLDLDPGGVRRARITLVFRTPPAG